MNKQIIIDKLVKIAESKVGVKEEGGNNKGAEIILFQQATFLKPDAWPWCAAFICWCIREWLKDNDVKSYLHLTDETIKTWRPRTASAFDFQNWAKTNRLKIFDEKLDAKAGDIVIFDFSHIGIVSADQVGGDTIQTIEGNTNIKGERDSHSGDGVFRKTRNKNLVRAYIRIIE
jgi:hypothetical protein